MSIESKIKALKAERVKTVKANAAIKKLVTMLKNNPLKKQKFLMMAKMYKTGIDRIAEIDKELKLLNTQLAVAEKNKQLADKDELLNIPEVQDALAEKGIIADGGRARKSMSGTGIALYSIGGVVLLGGLGYLTYWLIKK